MMVQLDERLKGTNPWPEVAATGESALEEHGFECAVLLRGVYGKDKDELAGDWFEELKERVPVP